MKSKKYVRYTLIADFGETQESFECYREAFSAYQKCDGCKTLYGFDEQDSPSVIMSHGG